MLSFELKLIFTYSALGTNKSLLVYERWKLEDFAVFWNFFSTLRDFISSANCSCCSSLKMPDCAPSFLQHLLFCCRFVFSKYALYESHCIYNSIEIAESFPLNDQLLLFNLCWEDHLVVLFVRLKQMLNSPVQAIRFLVALTRPAQCAIHFS